MTSFFNHLPIFTSNANVGIGTDAPQTALDVYGDMTVRGAFYAPNAAYEYMYGAGTDSYYIATTTAYLFGKNYDAGATGHLTSFERSGVTVGVSGWLDGRWHAPHTGKYLVVAQMYFKENFVGNRWTLAMHDSSGTSKYDRYYVNVEAMGNTSDKLQTFSMILNMNKADYFEIRIFMLFGTPTLQFQQHSYSYMKIVQVC